MKILLVDDNSDIANSMKSGLENLGYNVDAFTRPTDALQHYSQQYDVAVLDIRMPEMSGFELARRLWQQNKDLQVCFFSAFEINESEARATMPTLQSHCFVKKPITAGKLAAHIQSHFVK